MKDIEFVIIKIKSICTPDCGSTVKYCWPWITEYTSLALFPYVGSSASVAVTWITDVPREREREWWKKRYFWQTQGSMNRWPSIFSFKHSWQQSEGICVCAAERSTDVGHLRDGGAIRAALEQRWVVVDVLHTDDELGWRLQGSAGLSVCCRGDKAVLVLFLTV